MSVQIEKHCQADRCNNVIRGRRSDAKYCSQQCKDYQRPFNKGNGLQKIQGSAKVSVSPSGNIVNDVAMNAALQMLSSRNTNPVQNIGNTALSTCIPYAAKIIQERPLLSLALAIGGFVVVNRSFNPCTTTTETKNGETTETKSCRKATGIEKAGGAAVAILAGNYLLDNVFDFSGLQTGAIYTGNTRVIPDNTPVISFSAS